MLKSFIKDETGANAIEYSLIAAIIAIGITVFLPGVREALNGMFGDIETCLNDANNC